MDDKNIIIHEFSSSQYKKDKLWSSISKLIMANLKDPSWAYTNNVDYGCSLAENYNSEKCRNEKIENFDQTKTIFLYGMRKEELIAVLWCKVKSKDISWKPENIWIVDFRQVVCINH